jgi:hypothetical protein
MTEDSLLVLLGVVALLSIGAYSALKLPLRAKRLARRLSRQRWPSRPLPNSAPEDIDRIVRRDFPTEQVSEVSAALEKFQDHWENTRVRVRLAALKLADGNLEALRKQIGFAKRDYRDVLVLAEHPEYWKATSGVRNPPRTLSKKQRQQIVDADWQQYVNWVRKE